MQLALDKGRGAKQFAETSTSARSQPSAPWDSGCFCRAQPGGRFRFWQSASQIHHRRSFQGHQETSSSHVSFKVRTTSKKASRSDEPSCA
eukprot:222419-Pyramimonas_sp.AAC.1